MRNVIAIIDNNNIITALSDGQTPPNETILQESNLRIVYPDPNDPDVVVGARVEIEGDDPPLAYVI